MILQDVDYLWLNFQNEKFNTGEEKSLSKRQRSRLKGVRSLTSVLLGPILFQRKEWKKSSRCRPGGKKEVEKCWRISQAIYTQGNGEDGESTPAEEQETRRARCQEGEIGLKLHQANFSKKFHLIMQCMLCNVIKFTFIEENAAKWLRQPISYSMRDVVSTFFSQLILLCFLFGIAL